MAKAKRGARAAKGGGGRRGGRGVLLSIAIFKLTKGLLLLAVGVGALSLLGENVAARAARFVASLQVDPHRQFIRAGLVKLTSLDDKKLEEIGAGTFFYAALMLTEGVGLLLRKRWAEYFTIFATGSFIPLEIYELVEKFSASKIVVLAINIAVVLYLVFRVMQRHRHRR